MDPSLSGMYACVMYRLMRSPLIEMYPAGGMAGLGSSCGDAPLYSTYTAGLPNCTPTGDAGCFTVWANAAAQYQAAQSAWQNCMGEISSPAGQLVGDPAAGVTLANAAANVYANPMAIGYQQIQQAMPSLNANQITALANAIETYNQPTGSGVSNVNVAGVESMASWACGDQRCDWSARERLGACGASPDADASLRSYACPGGPTGGTGIAGCEFVSTHASRAERFPQRSRKHRCRRCAGRRAECSCDRSPSAGIYFPYADYLANIGPELAPTFTRQCLQRISDLHSAWREIHDWSDGGTGYKYRGVPRSAISSVGGQPERHAAQFLNFLFSGGFLAAVREYSDVHVHLLRCCCSGGIAAIYGQALALRGVIARRIFGKYFVLKCIQYVIDHDHPFCQCLSIDIFDLIPGVIVRDWREVLPEEFQLFRCEGGVSHLQRIVSPLPLLSLLPSHRHLAAPLARHDASEVR